MMMLKINLRGFATQNPGKISKKPVFGRLSNTGRKVLATQISENYYPDDPDGYDKEEYDLGPRKNAYYYKQELRMNAMRGKTGLKKALELFEEMKSIARLEPNYKHYAVLIRACAKAGYTQRAFELYKEYLRYSKKPSNPMITNLINACAECPFKDYGLAKLKWLRNHIQVDHSIELELVHYNCLIKAYGMLHDGKQIEEVIDDMFKRDILPNVDTFNMLLIACASDKQSGSILALSTYKRMRLYDFKPNDATFRLFVRCIRDCGMGSTELVKKIFADLPSMTTLEERIRFNKAAKRRISDHDGSSDFVWMPKKDELKTSLNSGVIKNLTINRQDASSAINQDKINAITSRESIDGNILLSNEKQISSLTSIEKINFSNLQSSEPSESLSEFDQRYITIGSSEILPNLLSDDHLELFTRVDSIDMNKTRTAQQRLLLFGGIHGFLENMVKEGIKPSVKVFSLLLGCIKSSRREVIEYYRLAMDYKIDLDVPFYDMLVRHASHNFFARDRLKTAMYIMEQMSINSKMTPNITTYEALATACDNIYEATKLIEDLDSCGFTISSSLIRNLFDCPLFKRDFKYLKDLVVLCQKRNYKPHKELIHKLIDVKMDSYEIIWKYENNKLVEANRPPWFHESQVAQYDEFSDHLESWLKNVDLMPEDHPWEQFHVDRTSKRQGFVDFVAKFKAIEQAKQEAIESGSEFGNLVEKGEKILSAKQKQSKLFIPSEDRLLSNPSFRTENDGYLEER